MLGGKYSSGIWTLGRLAAGAAAAPSTTRNIIQCAAGEYEAITQTFCSHPLSLELLLQGVRISRTPCTIQIYLALGNKPCNEKPTFLFCSFGRVLFEVGSIQSFDNSIGSGPRKRNLLRQSCERRASLELRDTYHRFGVEREATNFLHSFLCDLWGCE